VNKWVGDEKPERDRAKNAHMCPAGAGNGVQSRGGGKPRERREKPNATPETVR